MFIAVPPRHAAFHPTGLEADSRAEPPLRPSVPFSDASWRFGECMVRPACRDIVVSGQSRHLQPRPFDLLVHLIEHRDRVVSADELLDVVWGEQDVQPGALAMAIARIRAVLQGALPPSVEIIRTYHRVGYRFVAALE